MAIKEFIVKNKKRNICIMLALVLFITSVFVIKYVNRTNAGVFVKDDNGNISLKNNINILEIVAQNGQQVLGYTIEGQEPIKKSQIESYKGTMDLDVDDFRQATGYKVTKTQNGDGTFSYKVDGNVLNNTFNDNVLGKQMGVGEIKVNVVQASNVRVGDIDKADLIYINSNDYNDNLLYYYDQFVNKGSYGIKPGNLGISFNGRYSEDSDKFGASINKIKNAAGFPDKANLITKDDFGIIYENYKNATDGIDLNNYKEYNFDAYVEKLKTLPETTFSGDDRNIISRLNTELGTVNEEQKSYAEAFLKDKNNLTDENLEKTINYFFALGDDQLLEFNIEGDNGYISDLKDIFSVPSIHQVITERNIENSNIAATTLSDYKVKIDEEKAKEQETQNPEEETEAPKKSNYGLTPDDYKIIYDSIEKLNVGKTYGFLSDEYIKGYTDENNPDNNIRGFVDIVYTGAIDNANITTLIENINNKMREEYMKEIANLPGSGEDTIDEFCGNLADILEFVGINSYNKYYRDKYVSELKKLEAKAFLKEDGTPDEEKINTFFDSINADSISEITSYKGDMSFKPAMELYDRAINGKVALMYNSDLLSDGGIGKYNEDLQALAAEQYRNLDLDEYQVDNTNNVYKVLLLLRQIQPEYYNQTLKDKIDDLGAYWPEGIGNGGSYLSWNKETFGTDYTNYAKYHEPDVVGQTYDVNGIAGGNTSYVYKRIYTYSGNQFFGGKIFAEGKPVLENNYLSKFTFNNDKGIPYDNTLTSDQNSEIVNATKGGIIRYILNVTLTNAIYPINVLEIEPAAAVNKYASFDGAKQLAKMLNVDAEADGMNNKNYKNYINVKYMSVKEFNTRNEDLESMYDLIYFGIDSGYQVVNYYNTKEGQIHRTKYQDSSMNGLVYTGIGDQYRVLQHLKGDAPSDYVLVNGKMSNNDDGYGKASGFPSTPLKNYQYWMKYFSTGLTTNADPAWNLKDLSSTGVNKFYVLDSNNYGTSRLSGNDITVKRMNSLLNYVKAGYPIMMADELINSDNYIDFNNNANDAARWRYLDRYSKLYNFILQAKALGRDASGNYTDSSVFYDNKTYASIINEKYAKEGTNPDYLSSAEKFDGGLSFAYRRVAKVGFTFESGPQEYHNNRNGNKVAYNSVGTIIKPTEADYKNFNVVLDINNIGGVDQTQLDGKYTYQMIIDKSGVGKFEEGSTATIDCNYEYVTNDAGKVEKIKLSNKWPRNMSGFIPWKIEVTSKENPGMKFSYIGYSAFEDKSTPVRDVYVLWIYPESGNNLRFDQEINKYKTQINQGGYNIHLISVTYKIFNQTWAGETSYIDDVNKQYDANTSLLKVGTFYNRRVADHSTNLDGDVVKKAIEKNQSIDMIVVGFSDSHTEMDISNIAAQKNIQYFLDSGHSLLYSHDNSSYWYSMNWYKNVWGNVVSGSNWYWGRNSTSFFRRMLGMDQYGISYGGSKLGTATSEIQKQNIATEEQIYANAKSYLRPDLVKPENLRGITETTVFKSNTGDKLYSNDLYGTNTNNRIDWSRTNKVSKINKGQITEYPFILDDTINVSTTHAQYSTLSMEDPDLTVWYYLDDDSRNNTKGTYSEYGNNAQQYKFTKGDGANNYYIYSKGNITYTGAGHASGATESEMKLFINTVIASLKSGNYDPVVNIQNSYEAKDSKTGNTYKYVDFFTDKNAVQVIYNPSDYDLKDGELAFTDAKVFVDIDGDEGYTEGKDILLNDPNHSYLTDESGAVKNVIGSQLINRQDTDFYLTLDNINKINTVISQRGGSGDIYNYNIVIEVSDKGYLKSKNPIPGKGYDLFRLNKKEPIKYDYFNLN